MPSQRFSELRLVAPVVACWCVLLFVLYHLDVGLVRYNTLSWRDKLLIATSGIGIWMAVVWLSLFRRPRWFLIALFFLLFGIVLIAYNFYAQPRGRAIDYLILVWVCPLVASVVSLIPLLLLRRFSAWRIVEDMDSTEKAQPQFSRKRIFFVAAILVIFFCAVAWVALPEKASHPLLVAFIIPISWGLSVLFSMSNFRVPYVWSAAIVLGGIAAVASMVVWGIPVSLREASFLTTIGAYSLATCLLLSTASYLRLRSVLFQFGGETGFATRRVGSRTDIAKAFIQATLGLLTLMSILIAGLLLSRFSVSRQAQAKLSRIAESGLPTTRAEARQYFEALQSGPDLFEDWSALSKAFEEANLTVDLEEIFKHGDWYDSAFGDTPESVEYVKRLNDIATKHSALIEQIHSVARKDGRLDLFKYEEATYLAQFQALRTANQLLACDAVIAVNRGDSTRFVQAVEEMLRIAHLMDNAPVYVVPLARTGIIETAANCVHIALSRLSFSGEATNRLSSILRELDLLENMRQGLIGERALMAVCFQDLQLWQFYNRTTAREKLLVKLNAPADLCFYLDQLQMMIDAINTTPREAFEIADTASQAANTNSPAVISAYLLPPFRILMVSVMRVTFEADACRVGLAVEAYRSKYQRLPESLEALVPEFLDSVPIDQIDGKPLRFETTTNGYRIYSIGYRGKEGAGPGNLYFDGPKLVLDVPRIPDTTEKQ